MRVIDLTSARGELAGRILADLGAEVIKVERPGGAEARRLPPFDQARGKSLYWEFMGLGKRSIALDLTSEEDRERIRSLISSADILLESEDPGELARHGLDYESVAQFNPNIIYVSITPYGQSGPDANAPATDLTLQAAGGLLGLNGDGDRPPLPIGFPQASMQAGAQAAADALAAYYWREGGGRGQHLDVSMQASIIGMLLGATGHVALNGEDPPNTGESRNQPEKEFLPGIVLPRWFECADGWTYLGLTLGDAGARSAQEAMGWAIEEGALDAELADVDWHSWVPAAQAGDLSSDLVNRAVQQLARFLRGKTKQQIMERAVDRRIMAAPIYSTEDIARDRQLEARDYWRQVGDYRQPGPFAVLSKTPISLTDPAPALDADREVLEAPRAPSSTARETRTGRASSVKSRAFEGLRVADFAWSAAGPLISKALADHGATVIRVESATRLDYLRQVPPFKDHVPGVNRNHIYANYNTSKLNCTLNLATPEGRLLARRLADWADVVTESFLAGTMDRLGMSYEELSRDRDDLIMISSTLRGQTGPDRSYSGFGPQGATLAGFQAITGWPDRPPAGLWGAYTDLASPKLAVAALTAALQHRRETGLGQYIDVSQIEASSYYLGPLLLDYTANGVVAGQIGTDSPYSLFQGVFQTEGVERYVAVATATEAQWRALADVVEFTDPAGTTGEIAPTHRDEMARLLTQWCAPRDAFEVAACLKDAGVPASAVLRPSDLFVDPQLSHRGFFVEFEHPEIGPVQLDGPATKFSEMAAGPRTPGPTLGQHTDYVLQNILGLSPVEIAEYASKGALS